MAGLRLTKDNCEDIGFVKSCLFAGIVSFDEFKQWLFWAVENEEEVPNYFWDLIELKEKVDFKPLKIMGFTPYWLHSSDEGDALDGLGFKRNPDFTSDAISRTDALRKLAKNPHIEKRFRETFPFIEF
ncbi:hypothetical protein IFO68_12145 [Photobacterium sp. CAU 1568]|uniref:Uncharacterized protein n=1 Tax=Photobacterium arenosum TaxID=2774143 RepID=A0ABR9BLI0_9GAMM|nr:hypothetical protein [Photobacterium arenosum]MBD8513421.1 hypothetical protein [Photobacterium arenosum]